MGGVGGGFVVFWLQIVLTVVFSLAAIAVFTAAMRGSHPLRRLFNSGLQGIGALALVNATAGVTGVSVGFSWLAAGCGALLGIPGIIGLVLMQIILPLN